MRKQLRYLAILSLLSLFLNISCQRDVEGSVSTPTNPTTPDTKTVTATITGRVVDEKEMPVSGALVKAGSASIATDINGQFRLANVQVNQNAGFVRVEKAGYFEGSRTFVVNTKSENIAEIKLIPKKQAGAFSATSGGSVAVPNGGTVNFSSNSVVNASNNSVYNGNVSVAAFYLNPIADDFNEIMPGTLRGIQTNNAEVGLQSFGMLAVELNGSNGEKLQLASGKTAALTFPIPTTLLSSAPQTIPLWFFDESKGLWKEEGSATKQGSYYVGTVAHFSFWNCDAPYSLVDFEVSLKNQNGSAIADARVELSFLSNKNIVSGSGITDANGKVMGKIPANTQLQMDVINSCGNKIYSKEITTGSAELKLGTVTINTSSNVEITISGSVIGCNATPVTNGFVYVAINGKHYRSAVSNGSFSSSITLCSAGTYTATILGYDLTNNKQSDSTRITINTNAATAPISISVCQNTIDQFVNYSVNGQSYSLLPPGDSVMYFTQSGTDQLYAVSRANSNKVSMSFQQVTGTGNKTIVFLAVNARDTTFTSQNISTLNITEYTPTGSGTYIAGTALGNVKYDSSTISYPFNLSFRIKK